MKKVLTLLIIALVIILENNQALAQTYTLNVGSSFSPAWAAGSSSGTANNIGGSGVNCSLSMAFTGTGAFSSPYPRVNINNSNSADFVVQGSTDAMEIDIDLGNKTSYLTATYTFSKPVQNLVFSISDIDRPNGSSTWSYVDQVTVTGTGSTGTVLPTLTKYNTSSSIFNISSNVATGNVGSGGGNVASTTQNSTDQDGTMIVNFNGNTVTSFTIQYGTLNAGTVNNNPGVQAIAVGNMTFQKAVAPTSSAVTSSSMSNSKGQTAISSLSASDDESIASYSIVTIPSATAGTLYYNNGGTYTAVTAGQTLTPAQAASLKFDPLATFIGNATFTFTGTDNRGLVSTSSTFTIPVLSGTLPVTITNFSASWNNNQVLLSWTTVQEFNSQQFIIEKSNDGSNWSVMTTIAAAGTSNSERTYSATNAQPYTNTYYRLKEVDINGTNSYARVIRMSREEKTNTSIKIYPNPVTTTVTVATTSAKSQPVKIKVYSNSGLLVKDMTVQLNIGTNNINIPSVNTFANGFYILSIIDSSNNQVGTAQFIKQ